MRTEEIGGRHRVKEGEFLGTTGACGYSSGPHAHLELRVNNQLVDPDLYITNTFTAKSRYDGNGGNGGNGGSGGNGGNYVPVPFCNCSTSYEGFYQCTTKSAPLNVRSGHGDGYTKLGSIPSGATVVVTVANGSWAHVEYNGISGYASMRYLKKTGSMDNAVRVYGDYMGYMLNDVFSTGGNIVSESRKFADLCQTKLYGASWTAAPELYGCSDSVNQSSPLLLVGSVLTLSDGTAWVVAHNDMKTVEVLTLKNVSGSNVIKKFTFAYADAAFFFSKTPIVKFEFFNNTGLGGGSTPPEDVNSTIVMPEIIIHIDKPSGQYDGSNHIEISGWIAAKHSLTYVMGECEAFGQINLTSSITDASAELDAAGYSSYPVKVRYRSVIDRKYLQPNTTYTMKVWAGMANGSTSGVCGQQFDVTSIEPTVIRFTSPSGGNFAGGKDVAVAGQILSLNPITDVMGKIADINGSTQVVNFDLTLKENASLAASSGTYTYGYTFSGTMPLSLVTTGNTTASFFVTAIDENNIQKTSARTFVIDSVVRGDINAYEFAFDQEYVRIYNTDTQTLSGTVYANAPIADVMAQIYQWSSGGGIITTAEVTEVTPKSGYKYAKRFVLKVSAGDLCNILGVDSFADNEFRVKFWCDLVNDRGQGEHKEASALRTVFGNNVSMVHYTVNYNADGGSGAPGAQSFKHGKGVTISSTVPTKTGYSFRGWATSFRSNQVKYVPGSTYNTNSNVTLCAVWEKATDIPTNLVDYDFTPTVTIANAPKVYKFVPSATTKYRITASGSAGISVVIQNALGSTVASMNHDSSGKLEVLLNDSQVYYLVIKPSKAGATGKVNVNILRSYAIKFDANGGTGAPSGTLYQFAGESITLPETVPTIDPVTVTFDLGDGAGTKVQHTCPVTFSGWANYDYNTSGFWLAGMNVQFDRAVTLQAEWTHSALGVLGIYETPEMDGKVFLGWEDKNKFEIDRQTVALEDETYYARWTDAIPLEGLKLTPKTLELEVGDRAQLMVSPVPSGAILPEVVWSSSNTDTATVSQTGIVTILAEGASTITATSVDGSVSGTATVIVGTPIFTVSYDANGGTGNVPESVTLNYGDPYVIPDVIPVRTGHIFAGWAAAPDAAEARWQVKEYVTVEKTMTLYAVWEKETYRVIYDAAGGVNAPEAQTKIYGEALTLRSEAPNRDGYSFGGWALNPAAEKADYLPGDSYETEASVTLYALWRLRATGISLSYHTLAMTVGSSKALTPMLQPAGAMGGAVIWSSSNEAVATVRNGRVTAVSAGQAIITCTVADNASLTASCKVTVAAPQSGDAPDAPDTQIVSVVQGRTATVNLRFNSVDAAYAKLIFSYDASAMELTGVSAAASHVTAGTNAIIMAVSNGKIPDGTQAVLTFQTLESAAPGHYDVDVAVVECYTIDELDTALHAVAADAVQVTCLEHVPMLVAPKLAERDADGLGAGKACRICGAVLTERPVIEADRCYWLPEELKRLEKEALAGLPVQQVVLPEGTVSIGSGAFRACSQLLVVVIPASVVEIADDAFEQCDNVCIVAAADSAAQKYAQRLGIPCVVK